MKIKILQQPDCAIAKVTLEAREELIAEAGTMVAMSESINTSTTLRQGKGGGILGGLKRMVGGESLFLSVFRSPLEGGEVFLAPKFLGDILHYQLLDSGLVVQATSYLASHQNVNIDLGFQGFKSLFSGENIFWLDLTGQGDVLINSFGGIYEVDVKDQYIVDTGHIVAFEKTLDFEITKPGSSWLGAFLGGEGLVCRFRGQGKLYCQTHNPESFGQLIGSRLPAKKSSN
ncbi:MAG: TIGR00266 family protein [Cyanobacteriota bacterium]|nr:TIGR00266 family protein [Cyanobacteriota bacterium]